MTDPSAQATIEPWVRSGEIRTAPARREPQREHRVVTDDREPSEASVSGSLAEPLQAPQTPSPTLLLVSALLVLDALLAIGHIGYFAFGWEDPNLLLLVEWGYGELFQYAKFTGLAVASLVIALSLRSIGWLSWAAVFGYMAIDDSVDVHSGVARALRQAFGFHGAGEEAARVLGFRVHDLFEMGVSGTAGLILLTGIVIGWRRGDGRFRAVCRRLIGALILLVVFGVGLDVIHEFEPLQPYRLLVHAMALAEDWGEMLAVTLMIWIVVDHVDTRRADSPRRHGE